MFQALLILHNYWRWLVLASLLYSILLAWRGWRQRCGFGKWTNAVRHWTATIAHIQLLLGILLYTQSR